MKVKEAEAEYQKVMKEYLAGEISRIDAIVALENAGYVNKEAEQLVDEA